MYQSSTACDAVRAQEQKNRQRSQAGKVPRLALRLGGVLLCVVAVSCVTQTRSDAQGAQWQPGATPLPAARSSGNTPPGESAANQSQSATSAANRPASDPAAEAATAPQLGQLQLLSPQDPAGDEQTDRAPRPIERRSADSSPARGPIANPPRVRQFYSYSAIYAAGRCRFANCDKNGWNTPHAEGESESRCHDNSCLSQGWTTIHADGSTVEIHCNAGSCARDGWSTTDKDASSVSPRVTAETRCLPAGCFTGGWATTYTNGTTAETHCHSKSCLQSGWTTRFSSGDTIECRCHMQDCAKNGAECT